MRTDEIFNGRTEGIIGCVCGARFRNIREIILHCTFANDDDALLVDDEPLPHRLKRGDWNTERVVEMLDTYNNKLAVSRGYTQ